MTRRERYELAAQRRDETCLQELIALVTQQDASIAIPVADEAIQFVAPTRRARTQLFRRLEADPELLTSGSSGATLAVCRLALALHAAGASAIVVPRCARCGQAGELPKRSIEGGICAACYNRARTADCVRCGCRRRIAGRDSGGGALCSSCRARDPANHVACSQCRKVRPVNRRTEHGEAVCATCAQAHRAPERCVRCRQPGIIAYRARDGAICRRCYRAPRRRCGGCGRVRRIALSGRDGHPDLCGTCHWAAVATCARCGQHGACVGVRDAAPTCLRCLAAVRLDELLTGADGIAVPLAGLRDAFLAAQQPRSIHTWLDRSPARGLLRQLAVGELELSHESLDVLPQTPSLAHLRALLVAVDALPERDAQLARLEHAIHAVVDGVEHADDRRLLRAFATWRVLHRLRRRAEHRPTSPFAVKRARAQVAEAARLLAWLRSQDRALSDAGQADVDQWLAAGGHARQQIRSFLAWAAEHGSATALTIGRTPPATAPLAVDAEARWTLARRLLHDDSIDPGDRVAGALVVLYAQPVARIARLRTDDIHHDGDDLFLRFGRDRVLMPGPLGELVAQLPWHRQVGPSGAVPAAAQWLFPGRHAGQPQHPEHLRRRLGRLGIDCRANRTAALLQLAAEVPAAVLADTLNIHRRTAVRWSQHAGGNWAHYAARRAHTDPSAASTNGPGPGWQG